MKVVNLKEIGIKRAPSRNKFVVRWLDMSETEALSFDDYDDMRTVYHAINSYCRHRDSLYKPKQHSDQGGKKYLILKVKQ